MFFCIWCARPSPSLWQSLLFAGLAGFGTAIGVHPAIGYTDIVHLAPAVMGATVFALGIALTYRRNFQHAGNEPIELSIKSSG